MLSHTHVADHLVVVRVAAVALVRQVLGNAARCAENELGSRTSMLLSLLIHNDSYAFAIFTHTALSSTMFKSLF